MSSASIRSGSQWYGASCISSWYHWSRPSCMWTGSRSEPSRRTTTTPVIDGVSFSASSAIFLSGTI